MAGVYRIGKVEEIEEAAFLRVVELKSEKASINKLTRSVDNSLTKGFIENVFLPDLKEGIFEIFLKLDVNKLREIDNDEIARESFLMRRIFDSFAYSTNLLKMIVVVLVLKPKNLDKNSDEYLNDKDLEYLNYMLMWIYNDIYVMPLIHFENEVVKDEETGKEKIIEIPLDKRISFYNDFVRRMLEIKNSIAPKVVTTLTIPSYYKQRELDTLFGIYEMENTYPQLVVVDFGNKRLTSSRIIGRIPKVHKHYREMGEERYFIYGFNVKPHKKGMDAPLAEDFGSFLTGINAIGPPHNLGKPKFPPALTSLDHLPKVFETEEYKYLSLSNKRVRTKFGTWAYDMLGVEINFKNPKKISSSTIRKYNAYSINNEASLISEFVVKGETDIIREKLTEKPLLDEVNPLLGRILGKSTRESKDSKNLFDFF